MDKKRMVLNSKLPQTFNPIEFVSKFIEFLDWFQTKGRDLTTQIQTTSGEGCQLSCDVLL